MAIIFVKVAVISATCIFSAYGASESRYPDWRILESMTKFEKISEERGIVTLSYGHTRPVTRTWWICSDDTPSAREIDAREAAKYIKVENLR